MGQHPPRFPWHPFNLLPSIDQLGIQGAPRPMAPPIGGANTAARGLARGRAPHAPPPTNRVFILVSFTSKFTGNLEWMACKLITLFLILLHVIILHDYRFFFEIRPIEELQDSNSSPRREEVGRRTLGDYGGFLLSFFYRARFRLFTHQFPVFVGRLQKLPLRSLQAPQE